MAEMTIEPLHTIRLRTNWLPAVAACTALCLFLPLTGCRLATPFAGTGYSSEGGVTLPDARDTAWIAITHAELIADKRAKFDEYTDLVVSSLPDNDGYIGHSIRARILGNKVWTLTVWRDEAALNAFVRSPKHRKAMRLGLSGVARAQFLRMELPLDAVPPSWKKIDNLLQKTEFVDYEERRRKL